MTDEQRSDPAPMPPWVTRAVVTLLAGVVVLWVLRGLAHDLGHLLVILLVSLFLAFALEPAVNHLSRRGWRRGAATALVMSIAVAVILGFLVLVGSVVVDQVRTLIDRAPDYVDSAVGWINDTFSTNLTGDDLIARIQGLDLANSLAGQTFNITTKVLGGLLDLLTVLLFTFYLVADGPRLRRAICSVMQPDRQREVLRVWEVAIDKTGGYLASRGLLAVCSASAHAVAFTVIGVPSAVALAVWVGFASQFLPVVGTYLAGFLPLLVAVVDSPVRALWVLGFVVVYQQIENYLLAPRVTARTMEIHPAVAFGAVIAGAAILGTAGALLALPAAASIQAVVSSYVTRHDVVDSHLTDDAVVAVTRRSRWRR